MEDLIKKYINSVLTPEEFSKLSEYLSDKANDGSFYKLIKPYWDKDLHCETDSVLANKPLLDKIIRSIQLEEGEKALRKLKIVNWGLRIAAVFVVGLIMSTYFFFRKSEKIQSVSAMQTISIPWGARTNFILPDSSLVWLNSGSELLFPSSFGGTRQVTLSGEAYFEVAKNGTPFIVSTKQGKVEVSGTSFNVKAFSDRDFETTLVTGHVKVTGNDAADVVTLLAGQQATIVDGKLKTAGVETDLFTSWKDGKLIFRQEYLPMVAQRLERWYNVKIELDNDPRLLKIWYTGTLEMESFSEVLGLLKVTAPIDYTFNEKTRVIKITYKKK